MTEAEAIRVLNAIGLNGQPSSTRHHEWRRVYITDAAGAQQGRISFHKGVLYSIKWYVSKIESGPILADERHPAAWWLWTTRGYRLDKRVWDSSVAYAIQAAMNERAEKQALRDLDPKPRRGLKLNVRKHLRRLLDGLQTSETANAP